MTKEGAIFFSMRDVVERMWVTRSFRVSFQAVWRRALSSLKYPATLMR